MHHCFYAQDIFFDTVNDCVRKPFKIEFAIFFLNFRPPFGVFKDVLKCPFEVIKKNCPWMKNTCLMKWLRSLPSLFVYFVSLMVHNCRSPNEIRNL